MPELRECFSKRNTRKEEGDFLVTTLKFIYARVASQKAKERNVLKWKKCIKAHKKKIQRKLKKMLNGIFYFEFKKELYWGFMHAKVCRERFRRVNGIIAFDS